ncbi:hypothetical protein [Vibrio brasiliensis]|uniref:hypothetical protein n=1 Tax=Vibrio brasiliensis TaxID=170652 RepID=UPI001EFD343B|nr:hypothetical protein [Vibrio brasiliensis]MCG9726516.1 hypothetical protein [Vibrio brasiliensis]
MNEAVKNIEIVILGLISIYAMAWAVTAIITFPVISLGSYKYIIFIDKQLAKDLDKYYASNGYMRPKYQASWDVGSRFINYCLMYPFIRKRATTDSIKFKAFMWWNSLGLWLFYGVFVFVALPKMFNFA